MLIQHSVSFSEQSSSLAMILALIVGLLGSPICALSGKQRRTFNSGTGAISLESVRTFVATDGLPASYVVSKLRSIPHMGKPFTQGLEFTSDGQLVETSGDYPPGTGSFVRILDPETGLERRRITDGLRSNGYYIEGISQMNGHWFATTLEDKIVLEYDADFAFVKNHPFPYEGWGVTRSPDGKFFLATNSTEYIMTLDPTTFAAVDVKVATCLGRRVRGLNELEMVPDFLGRGPALIGNVINTRLVLVLDPGTARCTGVFRLDGDTFEKVWNTESFGYHVANGVAYDRRRGTFVVTGKNWDQMFEVRLAEAPHGDSRHATLVALREHLATEPAAWA